MFSDLPPITRALAWICVIVFGLQAFAGREIFAPFMLWPLGDYPMLTARGATAEVGFLPWQLVSYSFLHGNLGHLFFNALALVMFGAAVERELGTRRFSLYWFVCVAGAGLFQLVVATWAARAGQVYPTVGASGGVFGLLLAYGMMFPHRRVMLLIPPIPMKARTLVIVYGLAELALGVTGAQPGVAHFAHLGGMAFGAVLLVWWRRKPRRPEP